MLQYFFDFDRLEFVSFDSVDVSTEAAVDVGADVLTSSDTPNAITLDAGNVAPDPVDASATPDLTSADVTNSTGADQGIDLVDTSGVTADSTSAVGAVAESEECVRCMLGGFYDEVDYEAAITVESYNLFGLDFFG